MPKHQSEQKKFRRRKQEKEGTVAKADMSMSRKNLNVNNCFDGDEINEQYRFLLIICPSVRCASEKNKKKLGEMEWRHKSVR